MTNEIMMIERSWGSVLSMVSYDYATVDGDKSEYGQWRFRYSDLVRSGPFCRIFEFGSTSEQFVFYQPLAIT